MKNDSARAGNGDVAAEFRTAPLFSLRLYKEKLIERHKLLDSLQALRKIGWFSNVVIDNILAEAS